MTVLDWLLDSDPALRWQVLRDVAHEPADVVAAERARVATTGWGAKLLDLQDADGQWGGGTLFAVPDTDPVNQSWTTTAFTLQQLRDFGIDPAHARVRRAVALVRDNSKWEHEGQDFFDGEVEACINGNAVAIGAYFGENVSGIVEFILGDQLDDGGWNCEVQNGSTRSSFNSTISVLVGLLEYEHSAEADESIVARARSARERAHEYLLERRLMYRLSDGSVPVEGWRQLSYPPRWRYDVLRALDYFREAGVGYDERMEEALALVEAKRDASGRWPLENSLPGPVHFELDDGDGKPSRWNTLRAVRVLEHYRGIVSDCFREDA